MNGCRGPTRKRRPVKRQRMPRDWLDRLEKAIETGAFDLIASDRIVEIILQGRR